VDAGSANSLGKEVELCTDIKLVELCGGRMARIRREVQVDDAHLVLV
jgi:hypothetical protein